MGAELDGLRERLEGIADELTDLALDRLRLAASDPGSDEARAAQAEERRLTRARRAVEKAAALLAGPDTGD